MPPDVVVNDSDDDFDVASAGSLPWRQQRQRQRRGSVGSAATDGSAAPSRAAAQLQPLPGSSSTVPRPPSIQPLTQTQTQTQTQPATQTQSTSQAPVQAPPYRRSSRLAGVDVAPVTDSDSDFFNSGDSDSDSDDLLSGFTTQAERVCETILCLLYTYVRQVLSVARRLDRLVDAVDVVASQLGASCGGSGSSSDGDEQPSVLWLFERLVEQWATTQYASVCCVVVDVLALLPTRPATRSGLGHLAMGGLHTVFPAALYPLGGKRVTQRIAAFTRQAWEVPVIVCRTRLGGAAGYSAGGNGFGGGGSFSRALPLIQPAVAFLLPLTVPVVATPLSRSVSPPSGPLPEDSGGLPDSDAAASLTRIADFTSIASTLDGTSTATALSSGGGGSNSGPAFLNTAVFIADLDFVDVRQQLTAVYCCLSEYDFEAAVCSVMSHMAYMVVEAEAVKTLQRDDRRVGDATGRTGGGASHGKKKKKARTTAPDDDDVGSGGNAGNNNDDDDDDFVSSRRNGKPPAAKHGARAGGAAVAPEPESELHEIFAPTTSESLRTLTTQSMVHYCVVVLGVLVLHFARTPPGVLVRDAPGGVASGRADAMSVDELLGVRLPVDGGGGVSDSERVCVALRRAVSLLRLHVSLTAAVVQLIGDGLVPVM